MSVTTQSIIDNLETMISEVKADRKLDLEKRAKLVSNLVGRQIQAGALYVQFQKAVARLPEESAKQQLLLSGS